MDGPAALFLALALALTWAWLTARSLRRSRTRRRAHAHPRDVERGLRRIGLVRVSDATLAVHGATCHRLAYVCPEAYPAGLTRGEIVATAARRLPGLRSAHIEHVLVVDPMDQRPESPGLPVPQRWARWESELAEAARIHIRSHQLDPGPGAA